ncbi:MAG: hypothetical protein Q9201_003084 [Fulgogasparrea decipioides]
MPPVRTASNKTLPLPVPNPYKLQNTPYSIRFREFPRQLARADVMDCILGARRAVTWHIQDHGDGPIPDWPQNFGYTVRDIAFLMQSVREPRLYRITYRNTIEVLGAFWTKMSGDGYREHFGEIFVTATGEFVGEAIMAKNERNDGRASSTRRRVDPVDTGS